MEKSARQSNIELLRIVSMLGVIVLHYNNTEIGGALLFASGVNKGILLFLESIFICAVNLYMLISGYFLCCKNTRKIARTIELLIQVILFQIGFYALGIFLKQNTFSVEGLLESFIPNNYFVILYIVCFLISPYINVLLKRLGKKQSFQMLTILLITFSIWPTVVDVLKEITGKTWFGLSSIGIEGSQNGYTIVNFVLLYCIGAYLRLYMEKNYKYTSLLATFGIIVAVICVWAIINDMRGIVGGSAWEYCNPFIITEAVLLFMIFQKLPMKHNRVINSLSKGAFTVYLLHTPFLPYVNIAEFVKKAPVIMVLHILLVVVAIYCICFICYVIYEKITRPIIRLIEKKCRVTLEIEG